MNIIIATSNVDFAKKLKESFKGKGVNVVDIVTCLEDFLGVLGENQNVDGILLKTDLAIKGKDYRLEMLSDSILSIRKTPEFEKIVFSIMTDYPEGHPLLAEFFGMGIYNFFSRGMNFNIDNLINSFENPMSFSIAVKYRDPNPEIAWRRINTNPQTYHVKFENNKQEESPVSSNLDKEKPKTDVEEEVKEEQEERPKVKEVKEEKTKEKTKEKRQIKLPQINIPLPKVEKVKDVELDEEWFINQQEDKSIQVQPSVIGSVLISVAAVKENMGATNTAINLAKYIKQSGNDVALIEANKSLDFDRIHSLKEAENQLIDEMEFTFQGIDHFKFRDGFDIGQIYQRYQYIVLDVGVLENSPYKDEFARSHIKIVSASGDEWKQYWIEEFLLNHNYNDLVFVLPCASKSAVADVADRLKNYDVYALEKNSSPYIVPNESAEVYEQILLDHQAHVGNRNMTSKKQIVSSVMITALVMFIIFILLMYFFK